MAFVTRLIDGDAPQIGGVAFVNVMTHLATVFECRMNVLAVEFGSVVALHAGFARGASNHEAAVARVRGVTIEADADRALVARADRMALLVVPSRAET